MRKTDVLPGSPEAFAEDIYWKFSEFENLTVDEVKKCCCITLNFLMQDADTAMRMYYGEAKNLIKAR